MEKKRNNRLQFALSTLLLAVLLLASAAMTWWNCETWRPAFAIPISFPDDRIYLSDDDKYIFSYDDWTKKKEQPQTLETCVYDAQSGKLLHAWHAAVANDRVVRWIDECGYTYVGTTPRDNSTVAYRLTDLWRIDTGEDLLNTHPALAKVEFYGLLGEGKFALIQKTSTTNLYIVRFPSLEVVCDTDIRTAYSHFCAIAPDQDQVAIACGTKINLFSLSKGKFLRSLDTVGGADYLRFSPDGRRLAFRSLGRPGSNDNMIRVIDLENPSLDKKLTSDALYVLFTPDSSRIVYSNAEPLQLLLYDFKMDSTTVLQKNLSIDSTKLSGDTLYSFDTQSAWDVRTANLLYANVHTAKTFNTKDTAHDRYILLSEQGKFTQSPRIVDIQSNESTGTLRAARWPKQFPNGIKAIQFAHHSDAFITTPCDMPPAGHPAASDVYTVWHRGVPNRWWGFTTMPEFWLTLAFSILFVWNICRRRSPLP